MLPQLLAKDDFTKILQERFKTENVEFISASYNSQSENMEGIIGDHYNLQITYKIDSEEKTENFFMKTKPIGTELQKKLAEDKKVYEKEIFVYDYLFKEYEKCGFDVSFAPKCYFCKPFVSIVMENMEETGFAVNQNFFDLDHCRLSLKSLAQYHGNALSYEEMKSIESGKSFCMKDIKPDVFGEFFYSSDKPDDFETTFFKISFQCFEKIAEIMPETKEWKDSFKSRLANLLSELPNIFNKPLQFRKTCCHGDLWCKNMLFQYENNIPVKCCLVDYQLLRHHYPSFDVILCIFSNTSREFRKKHYASLLDYYYTALDNVVKKNGFDLENIIPKKHFLLAAEEFKVVAVVQSAAVRLVTHLPEDVLSWNSQVARENLMNIFTDKRIDIVLKGCDNFEEYRNCVFDDIYDLNELI